MHLLDAIYNTISSKRMCEMLSPFMVLDLSHVLAFEVGLDPTSISVTWYSTLFDFDIAYATGGRLTPSGATTLLPDDRSRYCSSIGTVQTLLLYMAPFQVLVSPLETVSYLL